MWRNKTTKAQQIYVIIITTFLGEDCLIHVSYGVSEFPYL